MMKGATIFGIIILTVTGFFMFSDLFQFITSSFSGESTTTENLEMIIAYGVIGVFFGLFLIILGTRSPK
jgi:hypothetical protein